MGGSRINNTFGAFSLSKAAAEYVFTNSKFTDRYRSISEYILSSVETGDPKEQTAIQPNTSPPANILNTDTQIAKPTESTVLVNGVKIGFGAYNIEGYNYFKLRDLAYVLNGTEKQFDVGWDGINNAITLSSGVKYNFIGNELAPANNIETLAEKTDSVILLNGKTVVFTAYNIGGYNYFRLRDIGEAFNFGIDWNEKENAIIIDTSKNYMNDTDNT